MEGGVLYRDLPTIYTNENWFVIFLSRVYFGDWVTEIWHFSPPKTNNSAQLRAIGWHKFEGINKTWNWWKSWKKYPTRHLNFDNPSPRFKSCQNFALSWIFMSYSEIWTQNSLKCSTLNYFSHCNHVDNKRNQHKFRIATLDKMDGVIMLRDHYVWSSHIC